MMKHVAGKIMFGNFKTPFLGMTFETVKESQSFGRRNDFGFKLELRLRLDGFRIK